MKHWNKLSILICVIVGVFVWRNQLLNLSTDDARTFLGLLAQISATMLGFLLAALAILASIAGHRLLRNMQRTGHYQVLLKRFFVNTVAFGMATFVALLAYLSNTYIHQATLGASIVFLFSALLLVDVGWRFWLVLSSLSPE